MARRSDHSREELQALALDAAAALVEREGPGALTARRVAAAIGYSAGTLYNIFANLDELVVHLNARTLDQLQALLGRHKLGGKPAADVERLFKTYLAYLDAHPNLWNLLFEHRMESEAPLPDWYREKIDGVLGLLAQALAPAFPPSRSGEARDSAVVLWASFHGICSLASNGKLSVVTGQTAAEMARRLTNYYLAGLTGVAPAPGDRNAR
jgi:AcrR family transcriptional regulator